MEEFGLGRQQLGSGPSLLDRRSRPSQSIDSEGSSAVAEEGASEVVDTSRRQRRPHSGRDGRGDIGAGERRRHRRQTVRTGHGVEQPIQHFVLDRRRTIHTTDHIRQGRGLEADGLGLFAPAIEENGRIDSVLLRTPRRERRDLRRPRRARSRLGEQFLDLLATFREQSDDLVRYPVHLCRPVHDARELNTEPRLELMSKVSLVQVAAGFGVLVEARAVERPPGPVR